MAPETADKTTKKPAKKAAAAQTKQLRVTLNRSVIGRPEKHKRVVQSLGLTRTHRSVDVADTPIIQGMLKKIPHLITVERIDG